MIIAFAKQILSLLLVLISNSLLAQQYTVNGNAAQLSCNEYRLTQAINTQSGSVWNNIRIDLTQSFDFNFDVFLGASNSPGADGIAFVLQPISTSVGSTGGGLGYEGIAPAVGVTIDTYFNPGNNDPAFDHIAIQLNGDLSHNTTDATNAFSEQDSKNS
ncbi:L-type lectin-domain containing protein [Ferruginibacter sp.]